MPRVEILVPRRSPSEVIERIAEQTAGPEVSELLDPVRYHGTPSPTRAFELRKYDWRPVRTGRARFKTVFPDRALRARRRHRRGHRHGDLD